MSFAGRDSVAAAAMENLVEVTASTQLSMLIQPVDLVAQRKIEKRQRSESGEL